MNSKKSVIETVVEKSRDSFIGRIPLIVIDTYEIEIMQKIVKSFDMVDLIEYDKSTAENDKVLKYLCTADENNALNFPKNVNDILKYIDSGNNMPFKGMVKIVDYKNVDKNEKNFGDALRKYVHMYIDCHDETNFIRNSVVFLYGDIHAIPKDLMEKYTNIIDVDYPETWERIQIVRDEIEKHRLIEKLELSDRSFRSEEVHLEDAISDIAMELAGFSVTECEKIVNHLIEKGKNKNSGNYFIFDPESRRKFIFEKKELMLKSLGNIMTIIKPKKPEPGEHRKKVEGFDNYYKWINKISEQMKRNFTLERGTGSLRGILVCGIPGCGKSESAALLGTEWELNTLCLDIGSMMNRYVGDSERNLRKSLRCAEIMSPVILYIDEMEKALSNLKSGGSSDGAAVAKRMFGYLLSWMQTHTEEVFVCATANNISDLPPEFFRSGRFDALFSTYMPAANECVEIFREQMKRSEENKSEEAKKYGDNLKPRNNFKFSLEKPKKGEKDLVTEALSEVVGKAGELKKFMTGADIKKIVEYTLRVAEKSVFNEGFELGKWKEALIETISSPNMITYGFSTSNQDKIATSYIRLMREKFIPVSEKPLFDYNKYEVHAKDGKVTANYNGSYDVSRYCDTDSTIAEFFKNYDENLFETIKEKIDFFADMVERSEAEKAIS